MSGKRKRREETEGGNRLRRLSVEPTQRLFGRLRRTVWKPVTVEAMPDPSQKPEMTRSKTLMFRYAVNLVQWAMVNVCAQRSTRYWLTRKFRFAAGSGAPTRRARGRMLEAGAWRWAL